MVLHKEIRMLRLRFLYSISIAVTTYDRTFLLNQPDKEAIRFRATAILFLIHFFNLSIQNENV
jgi:hypothetical protein